MKPKPQAPRGVRRAALVSWGAMALFLLLAALQAAKPLHLDAMDFPAVAQATAESGRPIYYRGEENATHNGLYHPPLYIYLLAAWFKLFGPGAAAARMFGAFSVLAFGWTTLLLARCLLEPQERSGLDAWFWPLFLLNPFALQCSAIPDIDTTIYGPLLNLLVWSVLRLSWREGTRRDAPPSTREQALVAVAFALCLWAKLTTVWAFIPFLVLLAPRQRGTLRGAAQVVLALTAGTALFLLTYLAYGWLVGLDVTYTWDFLQQSFSGRGHLPSRLANLKRMGLHVLRWTGPLPWVAILWALGTSLVAFLRRREERARPLGLILSLHGGIFLFYCSRLLTFGNAPFKYVFVSYGVALAALAWLAPPPDSSQSRPPSPSQGPDPARLRWGRWRLAPALLGATVGLVVGILTLRDEVVRFGWLGPNTRALLLPSALAVAGLILQLVPRERLRDLGRATLLAALTLHLGIEGGTAFVQARAEYSTTYDYGQEGLAEAASFIRQRTGPNDVVTSMKDLGYLSGRRYVENYSALAKVEEAKTLIEFWESGRVRYIVFTEGIGHDQVVRQPLLKEWLAQHAEQVASFGNYRIYQPHLASPPSAFAPVERP